MSPKKIQQFMDLVKKVQQRSDLQKLQAYLLHFPKLSYNKSEAECLTETIVQYIDVVINLSANRGYREQIKICTQWLDPLEQVITNKDICVVFIKKVTQKIFDILIEEDVKSLCVKKELLKTFINCVQKSPKEIRSKTVQELPNIYLFKIVDSLSTYGDFDFQVTLIEIVFRMYGKSAILSKLPDLLPESEELSHSFANINGDTFDEDVRKFLNILNQNSKKVFSVVCKDVFLGRIKCGEPMENVNGLWVDFNRSEKSVSWYTTTDSLSDVDLDENDAGWNHILFFVSDVELVQIYRPPKSNEAIVYVKLREPCLISINANVEQMESADNVKFILSCESDKAKTLLSQVLPAMFKHKLQNNPFKVSLGSKIVYKPLKVSVRKRAKSDSTKSKSDTSSFSERLNPFCGTKDAYSLQGSSTLHSISSSSTKCDVISISDGSMHSNESSVDLIPKSDDTENSQYETAQMCQLDSCKVSSVQHAKKPARQHGSEVLSDDAFLKEDPRRFQGDMKILSGRCSGTKAKCSQSSAATSTPKETLSRKREESQETEKNIYVWSNVAEPSSSDRYETALDLPQTQSQCVMKSCRESGTTSKSPKRSKISISKNTDVNILKELLLVNDNESHGKDENEMDLSQLKEKKPNRDSKKKTKRISNKENIQKKESPDVPNQDILPVTKPTSKKPTVIDDGKYTKMAVVSQKEPNEKVTKDDIGSEKYPNVLVAHSKPIRREDVNDKMRTKQKSGKDAITVDIESALDIPNQVVVSAVCKPTSKKDTVIDDGKYTELKTDSQQKPNEKVVTNDIPLSQEYPDILSQKIFQARSKPTLKEETLTSAGMDSEATMKVKRKSKKDVITVDIESCEKNIDASNQDVVPEISKPASKKDTITMDSHEKPNEKVAPSDVAGSEDILCQKDLLVHSKTTLREDISTSAKRKSKMDVITVDIESSQDVAYAQNQEVVPAINKPTPKKLTMTMDSQVKPNKKVTTYEVDGSEEYPIVQRPKILPAHSKSTLREDILTSAGMDTEATKKAKRKSRKDVITIDIESSEDIAYAPNQVVVPAINKKTPKKVASYDVDGSEEYPVVLSPKVLPAHSKPTLREDSLTSAGMDAKTTKKAKGQSIEDVMTIDIESNVLDVPNQEVVPVISEPTPKKDAAIDEGKYTKMSMDSPEKPKTKVAMGEGWLCKPVLLGKKFVPLHSKPKTTKKAERKPKDVITVDNESTEKNFGLTIQEVVLAARKSTPKNNTVIDDRKCTEMSMDTQKKSNKKAAKKDIGLSEEYPDMLSQKFLPTHNEPTGRADILTSAEMDTKTKKAKRQSREDVITIDIESSEENSDAPNQVVVPAIGKPTMKKDSAVFTNTNMMANSQKEPNEKVTKNDIGCSEKYPDVLVAHSKPIRREDILTTAGMDTKAAMRAKQKSREAKATVEPTEKNLDVPNQEVEPAVSKPTPKKDTVIDDGKYTEMTVESQEIPNKKVTNENIKFDKKLVVLIRADLLTTNKITSKRDYSTNRNSELKCKPTQETKKKNTGVHKKISSTQSSGEILSDNDDRDGESNQKSSNNLIADLNQEYVSAKDINTLENVQKMKETQESPKQVHPRELIESSSDESDVQIKKPYPKRINVIFSEDDDEMEGNSPGESKQPKTEIIKVQSEVANEVNNTENSENDLFEEANVLTGITGRANDVTTNLEYERQLNTSTVKYNRQENVPGLESTHDYEKDFNILKRQHNQTTTEEVNVLTGITNRANDVATNLEYERQLNASTVEYTMQENVPGLESTHDYENDFNTLKRQHNQTTTTLGSRKRRKLYNPEDFNCLENLVETEDATWNENKIENVLETAKSLDKETIEPSVREQEISGAGLNKRVKHRKVEKNDLDKTKKLKVLHPHHVLNIRKPGHKSRLNTAFGQLLDSFRNETKTSLFDIVQHNMTKPSRKPGRQKISKIAKKTDKKKTPKNNKRRGEEHKFQRMRARSTSDLSEVSLKLKTHDQCFNRETSFESCEEQLPLHVPPEKKICILSDIQIRPKRTLLDDKPGITKKKTKNVENPGGVIKDDLSGHMSRAEICNWIKTGSPNYSAKITERRNMLKYTYFMLKNALEDPDETEVYKDVQNVCKILKKYV